MRTGTGAIFRIAFLATVRSHPLRAGALLSFLLAGFAPSLVAFAFSGADSLAVEGALGTACLTAPLLALYAGAAFASGDRAAAGWEPLLRGPVSAGAVVAAAATGITLASLLVLLGGAAVAAAALLHAGIHREGWTLAGPLAAAAASTAAAAAAGLVLGTGAPRGLAAILATALAAAPAFAATAGLPLPGTVALLLVRDAAFGALPADAVLAAAAAGLLAAGAAAAATVSVLRAKDLAPRPRST